MNKGRIIILSGPSGSGKTTLHKKLLLSRKFKGKLVKSISATTRPGRPGERHGRDYLFISEKRFLYKQRAGHFLESQKVFRYYYGTPGKNVREILRKGRHVLLCIDVKGAKIVRRKHPEAAAIFINPPSLKELRERLEKRSTESRKDLILRLKVAREEQKEARYYDAIIVNDHLQRAYKALEDSVYALLFPSA